METGNRRRQREKVVTEGREGTREKDPGDHVENVLLRGGLDLIAAQSSVET